MKELSRADIVAGDGLSYRVDKDALDPTKALIEEVSMTPCCKALQRRYLGHVFYYYCASRGEISIS